MTGLLYPVGFGREKREHSGDDFVTLVQEAMSIMETMPRKNQQIVLELKTISSGGNYAGAEYVLWDYCQNAE